MDFANHHAGSSDETSIHESHPPVDPPRSLNLENRLLNLIDSMLFNIKSPDLRVTRAWANEVLHTFHAFYEMYSALMNSDVGAMEDALGVRKDGHKSVNEHAKGRLIDCFIEDFGAGIPMFVSLRDGLTKLLEFLHRRLQLPHVPRRIAFTLMETFAVYRNFIPLDNPEETSDTSGDTMSVQETAPTQRVGPMSDPPLAEDPTHRFDRRLQEMVDQRERTLVLLWQRRASALERNDVEEADAIDRQIDHITML